MSRIKYLFIWISGCHRFKGSYWSWIWPYYQRSNILGTCRGLWSGPGSQLGRGPGCWHHHHTTSSCGHFACPACRGMFWLELEYSMAKIQTKNKFDILFLIHTGSARASWKPWPQCAFFKIKHCLFLSLSTYLKISAPFMKIRGHTNGLQTWKNRFCFWVNTWCSRSLSTALTKQEHGLV